MVGHMNNDTTKTPTTLAELVEYLDGMTGACQDLYAEFKDRYDLGGRNAFAFASQLAKGVQDSIANKSAFDADIPEHAK